MAERPEIISSTSGNLTIEDNLGKKHSKGLCEAQLVHAGDFEYFFQLIMNKKLVLSQEISESVDFEFRKMSQDQTAVRWFVLYHDGLPRVFELVFSDNATEFKLALSKAKFEATFQEPFDNITADDQAWAADAVGGTTIEEGEEYNPDFDMVDDEVAYTMGDDGPSRMDRIKQLQRRATAADSASDDDDDDEEENSRPKKQHRTKTAKNGSNSLLESGTCLNRTYVVRGNKIGAFRYKDDSLEYVNTFDELTNEDGTKLTPETLQLHDADHKMLILDKNNRNQILNLDLETGTVLDSWEADKGVAFNDIAPRSKYAQVTAEQCIVATSDNALYTIDPRISQRNKVADRCEYKTPVGLTAIATNGSGQVATASANGSIRLYSKVQKNFCKTLFPGLGSAISHVDITEDGSWMVATSDKYLLLIPLIIQSSGKSGFAARMGKEKLPPLKLSLLPKDRLKLSIENVHFTKARFNTGTLANSKEQWIATATGPYIVIWDFEAVKKGDPYAYKIKDTHDNIILDVFRHNHQNEMVVAQDQDIFTNKISKNH